MEEEINKYEDAFNENMKIIEATELVIPMKEYPISGELSPFLSMLVSQMSLACLMFNPVNL